jgi:hypothetical protein
MAKEWSDGDLLTALDMVDRQKLSMLEVGACFGVSRSAVAGLLKRVRDETDKVERDPRRPGETPPCRPENRDGGMPALWWRDGLAKQVRREKVSLAAPVPPGWPRQMQPVPKGASRGRIR